MFVGQTLGPFHIDKELGAGAMGAVYRGTYVKTGQVVAIKVMSPAYGSGNNNATERFEREVDILKQLNHPNVVRWFARGKSKGVYYYAMEYVKGESLDKVMARRDRMSWQEVVELGQQLCAALQHAHEAGIVHRDLKPSNLMILEDGTLKLTDFGIAKDLDVTQLTGVNCTVGTAAYMSPEQCRGDANLTPKSDLYSLGVVFYELITGKKPFITENSMEMFMHHVQTTPPRPSRLAMDVPVWLDNLICQLLEKKPEQRPLDAAMVGKVLSTIQEKVEAQASAGVEAAKARRGDRSRTERMQATEEDREAARTLLGKKRRKPKKKPIQQRVWVKAVGIGLALCLVLGGLVYAILRNLAPPADSLYAQAEKLMKSDNPDDHDRARDGPILKYLSRYGDQDNEKTKQMRKWAEDYDVAWQEKMFDRHLRYEIDKKGLKIEPVSESQKEAFQAVLAEVKGESDQAAKLWQGILQREGTMILGVVAKRHLEMLDGIGDELLRMQELRKQARTTRTEPKLDEFRQLAFLAYRQAELGDRAGAQGRCEALRELAKDDPARRFWQIFAAVNSRALKDRLTKEPQNPEARVALVKDLLAQAQANKDLPNLDRRLLAKEIVLLYDREEDFREVVAQARKIVEHVDGLFSKP